MKSTQFLKLLLISITILASIHTQVVQQINIGASTETSLQITNGNSVTNGSFQLGIDASNNAFIKQYENLPLLFFTYATGYSKERLLTELIILSK